MKSVIVVKGLEELYEHLLRLWREIRENALDEKNIFNMALSGGRTPYPFYSKLALQKADWSRTNIFMVDERVVPLNSNDNNYHNAERVLFSKINIAESHLYPINTNLHSFELSIEDYNRELKFFFNHNTGGVAGFDFILLGLGRDGHTASLFPGTKALNERYDLATAGYAPSPPVERITMTYPLINSSDNIIFLISGAAKKGIVKRLIEDRDSSLPASEISPVEGKLYYLIDKEAASELDLDGLDKSRYEVVK